MKATDKFDYKNEFSSYKDCHFSVKDNYIFGNKSLSIVKGRKCVCVCTAEVGTRLEDEICINPNCDDENISRFLNKIGIIGRKPSWYASVGYYKYPIYELTKSGKELFNKSA